MWRSDLFRAHCLHYYDHAVPSQGMFTATAAASSTSVTAATATAVLPPRPSVCATVYLHVTAVQLLPRTVNCAISAITSS
jgi:hypothetical protein